MLLVRLALVALIAASLTGCREDVPVVQTLPTPAPSPTVLAPLPTGVPPSPLPQPAPAIGPNVGNDISWPNCPVGTPGALPQRPGKGEPLPSGRSRFVIIGLTNGPGFYANPCLSSQVAFARQKGLLIGAYAVTSMPNAAQVLGFGGQGRWSTVMPIGRLQNAAYQQALINIASLKRVALRPRLVWLDIEPVTYLEPWSKDPALNRAVISAAMQAYADAGIPTGFYSSDNPWKRLTGGVRDTRPTWVTAGPHGEAAAARKCRAPTFSGGPALIGQWYTDHQDMDLLCPGARAEDLFVR